jgi:hypothetical protein
MCCHLDKCRKNPPEVTALGSFIHRLPTAATCQSTPLTSGFDLSRNKLTSEGLLAATKCPLTSEFLCAGWHITVGTFQAQHYSTLQHFTIHYSTLQYTTLYRTARRLGCGHLNSQGTDFFCDGPLNLCACLTINVYIL